MLKLGVWFTMLSIGAICALAHLWPWDTTIPGPVWFMAGFLVPLLLAVAVN